MKTRVSQTATKIFSPQAESPCDLRPHVLGTAAGEVRLKMSFVKVHERRCEIAIHHPPKIIRGWAGTQDD
jgi:hypothetical protein